jgi:hypothetical protein
MIKRRFGEDFATKISANIEIKAAEVARRDNKGKRRPRADGKDNRADRKPREQREKKEEDKPAVPAEEAPKQEAVADKDAPKREGRRRGGREGQQ